MLSDRKGTERQRIEQALREQEAKLRRAQQMGGLAHVIIGPSGEFLAGSETLSAMIGRDAATMPRTMQAWLELIVPEDRERVRSTSIEASKSGAGAEFEYRLQRASGEYLHIRQVTEPLDSPLDPTGAGRSLNTFQDLTERKRDEQALIELKEQLGQRAQAGSAGLSTAREGADRATRAEATFLATVSHELRTPAKSVIGLLDTLSSTALQPGQSEIVRLIGQSADRLLKVIDDTLDLAEIEAGKLQIGHAPMRLGEAVEKVCGMLDSMAMPTAINLTVFIDPDIPEPLLGDELRLRQVLMNLVTNAITFSAGRSEPGRVCVRAELLAVSADTATVTLSVIDNGIGMDQQAIARLFAPFAQTHGATTRRAVGTGLGLAISRMLIELMGGELSVRSEPGRGSTFRVRLQLRRDQAQPGRQGAPVLPAGLQCRLVGPGSQMITDLARYLQHAGVRVHRNDDLRQAAQDSLIKGLCLWIVLSDWPAPTGVELRPYAPFGPGIDTRFVILCRGGRRRPRKSKHGEVSVDLNALTRQAFYGALALACDESTAESPSPTRD